VGWVYFQYREFRPWHIWAVTQILVICCVWGFVLPRSIGILMSFCKGLYYIINQDSMECQPIGEVLIRQESGIPCSKEKLFGKCVEVCWGCGRVVSFFDFPYFSFHYPEFWGSITMSKQYMFSDGNHEDVPQWKLGSMMIPNSWDRPLESKWSYNNSNPQLHKPMIPLVFCNF